MSNECYVCQCGHGPAAHYPISGSCGDCDDCERYREYDHSDDHYGNSPRGGEAAAELAYQQEQARRLK